MARKNTLLKPHVRFVRSGSEIEAYDLCAYVESDAHGNTHRFGTRQERDRWINGQER